MTGKSDQWFGTGFGSHKMTNTYSIVADGIDSGVSEWQLYSSTRGRQLPRSISVISNTVVGDERTVVVERGVEGAADGYYNFPTAADNIEVCTFKLHLCVIFSSKLLE